MCAASKWAFGIEIAAAALKDDEEVVLCSIANTRSIFTIDERLAGASERLRDGGMR